MFVIICVEKITNERTVLNMILFFMTFIYMGVMLYFKKYDSSLSFKMKEEEEEVVVLQIYFRHICTFKLTDVSLSVEYSSKSDDMEYCLSTPKGKFYIPKQTIFNSNGKFKALVKIFDK